MATFYVRNFTLFHFIHRFNNMTDRVFGFWSYIALIRSRTVHVHNLCIVVFCCIFVTSQFDHISLLVCDFPTFTIVAKIFGGLSVCMSVCMSVCLSVPLLIRLPLCRRFGLSTFCFFDVSVCRHLGLATCRSVDVSVCRRFDQLPMKLTYTTHKKCDFHIDYT